MEEAIRREEASEIARKLNECMNNLQRGNIFSCIISFREVLEKMLTTKMLSSDEKDLNNEINLFQRKLAASAIFREVYGPVTFRDNEIATALAFMKQLIVVKEEETRILLEKDKIDRLGQQEDGGGRDDLRPADKIKVMIEKGDYATAQETIAEDEEMISLLVEEYNDAGIAYRRAGRFDEAISELKKALVVSPRDEGLYYNIARVYIDKDEWNLAAETIGEGLKINNHFPEGIKLLKYIREKGFAEDLAPVSSSK